MTMANCMLKPFVTIRLSYWLFGGLLIGFSTYVSVHAEKFTVPLTPNSFDEVEQYVAQNDGQIFEHLADAQCGGWDASQSVGTSVGQGIAEVTGVPGRKIQGGNPLNAIDLGVALKEDQFSFPDEPTTCGFATACLPSIGGSARNRVPFLNSDTGWQQCERPLDGYRADDFPDPDGRITYSCGGGKMEDITDDGAFCSVLYANNPGYIRTPDNQDSLDEDTTGGICQKLNEDWIYSLWRAPLYEINPANGECVVTGYAYQKNDCMAFDDDQIRDPPQSNPPTSACPSQWQFDSYRYCCTDQPLTSEQKNCVPCTGSECHQGMRVNTIATDSFQIQDPNLSAPYNTEHPNNPDLERKQYSFFRHYLGSYNRDSLETGNNTNPPNDRTIEATTVSDGDFDDSSRTNLPIPCYGYWTWSDDPTQNLEVRWDPKLLWSPPFLMRCVISSYYEPGSPLGGKHFYKNDAGDEDQMKATQAGKGSYFAIDPNTNEPYKDPPVDDAPRTDPEPDDDTTVWYKSLGRAFSLISATVLEREDFTFSDAILTPDVAIQRSTVQRYVPNKNDLIASTGGTGPNAPRVLAAFKDTVLSRGSLVRAFDEMVTSSNLRRPMVEWWQQIETAMNTYLTPPTVRLILPAAWSVDLDPLHPLLTPQLPDTTADDWRSNPEIQSIAIQLELHEDLLGEVTSYLEDSLLAHYTPEEVTVLVPSGSAVEYRALAQKWCTDAIDKGEAEHCAGISGDKRQLIDRLLEYADRIEDSRQLRAQATELQGKFLSAHTQIQQGIGQWLIDNTQDYLDWRSQWEQRRQIVPFWQLVQGELRDFTWQTNQPWCMNQRFTLPIYSLLDTWFPYTTVAGQPIKNLDNPDFPRFNELNELTPQPGITFDASHISIGTGGTFAIPVLTPLPVALNTLELGRTSGAVPQLVALPAIPDFSEDLEEFVPQLLSGGTLPLRLSEEFTLETVEDPRPVLQEIRTMFFGMNNTYQEFWDTITVDPADVEDGTEEDCLGPNTGYCKHFEFDLHERLMRIGSRPNILLQEDFENNATFMDPVQDGPYACLDQSFSYQTDWVCQTFAPHHVIATQGFGVQNFTSAEQEDRLDELRLRSLEETLQNDADNENLPPYRVPRTDILPSFNVNEPIILHSTGAEIPDSPTP